MRVVVTEALRELARKHRVFSATADRLWPLGSTLLVGRDAVAALPVQLALNEVVAEFGDVARTVHDALADNVLTSLERRQISKQAQELIDALRGLITSAKQA